MKQLKTEFLRALVQKSLTSQFKDDPIVMTVDVFKSVQDEYNASKFVMDGELHLISVGIAMKQLGHKKMRLQHNIGWEIAAPRSQ